MEDFSKAGMVAFAEMMTSKGWINPNTGGGYKAALNKILGDLSNETDVRKIDVKTQILRYNNLHPGELSPASLKQYEKRVGQMIQLYESWKTNPTNFKPPQREVSEKSDKSSKPTTSTNGKSSVISKKSEVLMNSDGFVSSENELRSRCDAESRALSVASTVSLTMPFPMRDDYLASITIPRDMKKDEADRLCIFIKALARE